MFTLADSAEPAKVTPLVLYVADVASELVTLNPPVPENKYSVAPPKVSVAGAGSVIDTEVP